MSTPTIAQLKQAITIAEQIEKLQAGLADLVGGHSSPVSVQKTTAIFSTPKKGKRTMSAETIAKMKAAQQARWAKKKGLTGPVKVAAPKTTTKTAAAPRKKEMSPETRAKITAALKARWAAKKKAAK